MKFFKLPDLGEGLAEAEIVEWKVSAGDTVSVDQVLLSVETAKALVDVPSPVAGVIARLCGQEGDILHIGAPLVEFEGGEDDGTVVGKVSAHQQHIEDHFVVGAMAPGGALVQAAGGRDEKFELVHGALPGVITLQVYRKLTLLTGELHSLGFTWADKQSISRLSREQVLEMLERSRRYVPALSSNEEWSKMVDQEVYDIRRLPADVQLRIRRPVKTHPMINLLWQDRAPRKQQLKASLPLLLCSDTQPAVTHLGHYPPKLRQARRDRKIGGEAIIERLHLYRYQG